MTPLAASIIGYVCGLVTAAFIAAIILIVHGGREHRRADRVSSTRPWPK